MSRRHHGRPHHGRHRSELPRAEPGARPAQPSAIDAAPAAPGADAVAESPPPLERPVDGISSSSVDGHAPPTNGHVTTGELASGPTNGAAAGPTNGAAQGATNGAAPGPTNGGSPGRDERPNGCTAPQLRRFIKSRPYVPMHELRRRFAIDGNDDDVTQVRLEDGHVYVGLPAREGSLLGELLRGGEIGYELSFDPRAPIVVGVYPMRPVPRP
jgi:hypothetical protein